MTDPILTPELYGPGDLGEVKATPDAKPRRDDLIGLRFHALDVGLIAEVLYWTPGEEFQRDRLAKAITRLRTSLSEAERWLEHKRQEAAE